MAMASTALAVLIGSAVEDPKMAIEFLPVLFVPQILFAGFFVNPKLIPIWLRCVILYFVSYVVPTLSLLLTHPESIF